MANIVELSTHSRMDKRQLIVFSKAPIEGHVKTRLQPQLDKRQALRLHCQLLDNTLAVAAQVPCESITLVVDQKDDYFTTRNTRLAKPINIMLQQGTDLGACMVNAFASALSNAQQVVAIGSDCPVISVDYIMQAFVSLDNHYTPVLGPADDGGYVLIGMSQLHRVIFNNIPWGTSEVFAKTRAAIQAYGLNYHILDQLWDVDRYADYLRYQALQTDIV